MIKIKRILKINDTAFEKLEELDIKPTSDLFIGFFLSNPNNEYILLAICTLGLILNGVQKNLHDSSASYHILKKVSMRLPVQNFGGFRRRLTVVSSPFLASKVSYSQTAAKMFAMKNTEKLVRMFGKISSYRRCFTSFAEFSDVVSPCKHDS